MKALPTLLAPCLILLMLMLSGCPIGLDHSAGNAGKETFNRKLIGKWKYQPTDIDKDAEVLEVDVQRGEGNSLQVQVKERGGIYTLETDNFTGYETEIDGLHVLYFVPENETKFYHYQYKLEDNNTLILADISLLDGGVDAVTSVETLRDQIKRSMSNPEFYKESKTYKRSQ